MNFETVKTKIIDMEYGWNIPTLIVLVPGLALIVQKIQISHILRELEDTFRRMKNPKENPLIISPEFRKIEKIYKWHMKGGQIQMIVFGILSTLWPLLLIPSLLGAYQFFWSKTGYEGGRKSTFITSELVEIKA